MKWPRGKYNGQRIVGFRISLTVNVEHPFWLPRLSRNHGEPYLLWLIFHIRARTEYGTNG